MRVSLADGEDCPAAVCTVWVIVQNQRASRTTCRRTRPLAVAHPPLVGQAIVLIGCSSQSAAPRPGEARRFQRPCACSSGALASINLTPTEQSRSGHVSRRPCCCSAGRRPGRLDTSSIDKWHLFPYAGAQYYRGALVRVPSCAEAITSTDSSVMRTCGGPCSPSFPRAFSRFMAGRRAAPAAIGRLFLVSYYPANEKMIAATWRGGRVRSPGRTPRAGAD